MIKESKMSGKLKNVPAINTNTLTNNFCRNMCKKGNDECICKQCYSHNMLKTFRRNCVPRFEENSKTLSKNQLTVDQIPKFKKNNIVRINAHGELINSAHAINILIIAKHRPNKTIVLYTKRLNLINDAIAIVGYKPRNLIIVYSNPNIDKPIKQIPTNALFENVDKVFNVVTKGNINCGARNCNTCRKCYDLNKENILYEQLK